MKLGSNVGPKPPKERAKRRFGRYQKARRANNIGLLAQSAKPPSPVQIRAAPPNFIREFVKSALRRELVRGELRRTFSLRGGRGRIIACSALSVTRT